MISRSTRASGCLCSFPLDTCAVKYILIHESYASISCKESAILICSGIYRNRFPDPNYVHAEYVSNVNIEIANAMQTRKFMGVEELP